MSEIRVDNITDEAGTGSPDFINGLTVQGRPVETGNTTVRQTVLSGPVDSDGRADFLSAGTGLQVVSIASAPLNITFGDGFNDGKQRNFGVSIDSNLTWGDLPDDEDAVFLVLEIDGETVTPIHTTLEPHYGLTRPDTPSEGQLFYPTDHRHQMERYDGSEWKRDKNWIVVGECATSGGSVVETRSYAYQGKAEQIVSGTKGSDNNFSHNIGTRNVDYSPLFSINADGGIAADDWIDFKSADFTNSSGSGTRRSNGHARTVDHKTSIVFFNDGAAIPTASTSQLVYTLNQIWHRARRTF